MAMLIITRGYIYIYICKLCTTLFKWNCTPLSNTGLMLRNPTIKWCSKSTCLEKTWACSLQSLTFWITLWLCQNNYGQSPFMSWIFPLKMLIFHSVIVMLVYQRVWSGTLLPVRVFSMWLSFSILPRPVAPRGCRVPTWMSIELLASDCTQWLNVANSI